MNKHVQTKGSQCVGSIHVEMKHVCHAVDNALSITIIITILLYG